MLSAIFFIFTTASVAMASEADYFCWTATPKHHIMGLQQANMATQESCLNHCKSMAICSAVDWDTNTNPKCWVQLSEFNPADRPLLPMETVTNFQLDRNCLSLISGADLSCWSVTAKYHYTNEGLDQHAEDNIIKCLNFCSESPNCAAVDWDTNTYPRCWTQQKNFQVTRDGLRPLPSATNFILDRNCYNNLRSVKTGPGELQGPDNMEQEIITERGRTCWMFSENMAYSGKGMTSAAYNTLKQCVNYCARTADCKAISFATSSNECKVLITKSSVSVDDFDDSDGVTSYLYVDCQKL